MWTRIALALSLAFGLMAQAPSPSPPNTPAGFEVVELKSSGGGGGTIKAYVRKPVTSAKAPAVIMLHGCGGLFSRRGDLTAREVDWIERFAAAGYVVMLPDSFNPRGFRQICTERAADRSIRPRDRAEDAAAAAEWLAAQPFVDGNRIALVGWSHGGSSTLWAVRAGAAAAPRLRTAIAFYPGCRPMAQSTTWAPAAPLTILIGDADDWTAPEPCRELVKRHPAVRYVEYPGAVHGFDSPNSPLRTRSDVGSTKTGTAKIGTDPKARAAAIDEVMRVLAAAFK